MFNWVRRYFFRKQVRLWCLDIRLHRELVKEIRKLQTQAQQSEENPLMMKFICLQLDLFMPDYRRLDDLLLKEKIARLKIKLNKSRTPMQLMATKIK
jgi:hypothetical protein